MKLYVKRMYDWNHYAYYAEEVAEQHWGYFGDWWQLGDSFIKVYDNVADFEYCAENFTKHGETAIRQQLKLLPCPWSNALSSFAKEMKELNVEWYVHGSVALALWGIDVSPKDVDIIIPNYSDFDRVRERFFKLAIYPIERCDNWLMSGLGSIFTEAVINLAFHNKELEPYDMSKLGKVSFNGTEVSVSTLGVLKRDNESMNRIERVRMIDEKLR